MSDDVGARFVITGSRGLLAVAIVRMAICGGTNAPLFSSSTALAFLAVPLAGISTPIALCNVISSNFALLRSRQFASSVRNVSGVVLDTGVDDVEGCGCAWLKR